MSTTAIISLVQALVNGVPRLVELFRGGHSLKDIRLGDFVSNDALARIEAVESRADDFIKNG